MVRNLGLIFLAVLSSLAVQGQIISDFSTNADGWTCFNVSSGSSSAVAYNNTGGNPSGNISFTGSISPTSMYFNAPAKFNGNLSTSYNQNLSFDLMQSTAGSDNSVGDLIIANGATILVYQLPTKPNAGSWSSYTVLLKETASGWHIGNATGAAPTKDQMKLALSGVTSFRIRVKYVAGATLYTGSLDNVVLNVQVQQTPPSISAISPTLGVSNFATVTITGNNFNAIAAQNLVFFNGVRTTALSSTTTQLTVKVPQGAQFGRITVLDLATGLSAQSMQNFSPQFDNNKDFGWRIIPASLASKISIPVDPASTNKSVFSVGDVDGDGWNDLVASESQVSKVSIWRNLQVTGSITAASFASKVSLPLSMNSGKGNTVLTDFDGDGKLDLIVGTADASAHMAIFRNTSVPGTISFAPADYMTAASYVDGPIQAADIDGDGRPELLSTWDNSSGGAAAYFTIFQNLSTPGDIEFAPYQDFDFNILQQSGAISTGDLDGDGKLDVAVVSGFDSEFYLFQNTSTPGNFSFDIPFAMNVGGSAHNVAIADMDNDNKLDLVWNGYNTSNILVSKNIFTSGTLSASSFSPAITLTSPIGYIQGKVAVADINGDAKPDIILAGNTDMAVFQNQSVSGLLNASSFINGTPFAGNPSYSYFTGPVVADFNADGKLDIVLGETGGASPLNIDIYQNQCYPAAIVTGVAPSPSSAGQVVTLTGDLMQTGSISPTVTVRDGILKTISNSPSNTTTTITIPNGGKSDHLDVTVHGLTTSTNLLPVIFPTSRVIDATSFPSTINFPLSGSMRNSLATADWDDDGKPDVGLIDGSFNGKLFQNTQSSPGPITAASLTQLPTLFSSNYFMMAMDIDGDGKTDMHSGGYLFRNSSTGGTISFASSPGGVGTTSSGFTYATTADFNLDGKIDIAGVSGSNVALYENLSASGPFVNNSYLSTFSGVSYLPRPASNGGIVAADFDGDGFSDLAANNQTTNNFSYYRNLGVKGTISTASFSAAVNVATGLQPYGIIAADFDRDGKQDLAITHYNAANNYVSVYRNTSSPGTISFAAPVNLPCVKNGFDIIAQDMDGDSKSEILVIHQPNPGPGSFSIFQNTSVSGTPSFAAAVNYPLALHNPQFIATADINLDNKPDILIVAFPFSTGNNALLVLENKISTPVISIGTQPSAAATVCSGAIQNFSTSATGTTNINYQWQIFNSGTGTYIDLSNSGGYSNVSTSTLSINSTGNFGGGTYQCKISGDFAATVYTSQSVLTVNPLPTAPVTTGASACLGSTAVLNASGGVNGQYQWYAFNNVAIAGEVNSTYTTVALDSTKTYYVSFNNGTCESSKTVVVATMNTPPGAPAATGASACRGTGAVLNASGGTNGQYRWYTFDGVAINGEVNSTYTTVALDSAKTYYVSINNGTCESQKSQVIATLSTSGCAANQPPIIVQANETTIIGGEVALDLSTIVSDPNNNIDLSTLSIVSQPQSGAVAAIDSAHHLIVNYDGLSFSGTDTLTIQVCDLSGACTQQKIIIEVGGKVIVFNAVSPNGDGKNDVFVLEFIDELPATKDNVVAIFNRWGDEVFSISNYNNTTRAFAGVSSDGKQLPPGTYFYKVTFSSGAKTLKGYLQINR